MAKSTNVVESIGNQSQRLCREADFVENRCNQSGELWCTVTYTCLPPISATKKEKDIQMMIIRRCERVSCRRDIEYFIP